MTKNLDKEGLSSIVDNYELFYIDLWGVIHNGIKLQEKAINSLKQISKHILQPPKKNPSFLNNSFIIIRINVKQIIKYFLEK